MATQKAAPTAKKRTGLFGGVGDARVGQGGLYFLPGIYKVKIIRFFAMESRKKEDLIIAECEILESDNPQRKVGSKPSWVVNLKQDAALGNIKGFLAACLGIDPSDEEAVNEQVTEDFCEEAVDEDENPMGGVVVGLEAVDIKTRAGGDFTLHKWSPVAE